MADKDDLNEYETRTTAEGLLRYANDYFEAFKIVKIKEPKILKLYQVKFYLICHSLELVLKADLKRRGYSISQLLKIGHDLEKMLKLLKEKHEVVLDLESLRNIRIANDLYKSKQYEYPLVGLKYLANFDKLESITHLILTKTEYWLQKDRKENEK